MQSAQNCQFIFVSVGGEENASAISRALVENKLAACVSRIPQMTSVYRWEDKIQEDREILLIIKTQKIHSEKVEELIKKVHTYDVPEIVSISLEEASSGYLGWLLKETS